MLDALYNLSNKKPNLINRKCKITKPFTIIKGAAKTGKTSIIKQYLSTLPSASYLYIDLNDLRIDIAIIKQELTSFCRDNKIQTLVIEAYDVSVPLPNVSQIILSTEETLEIEGFETLNVYNLDFEEFLAFDSRYDSLENAFTHFLQTSSYPKLYFAHHANRQKQMQSILRLSLHTLDLQIMNSIHGFRRYPFLVSKKCTGCLLCENECPTDAIEMNIAKSV